MRKASTLRALLASAALAVAASACTTHTLTMTPLGQVRVRSDGQVSQLFRVTRGTQPVPGLARDRFTFGEDGNILSAGEADARVDLNPQAFRLYTVLLLDVSGSMREHLTELKEAARAFVQRLLEDERSSGSLHVSVYAFAGDPSIHPLLTESALDPYGNPRQRARASNDVAELSRAIDGITCEGESAPAYCRDRSTNLHGAVISGVRAMREFMEQGRAARIDNVAGSLVLFTDGADRAGRVPQRDVTEELRTLRDNEYVFGIGLGTEVDAVALRGFSRSGYVPAQNFVALQSAFGAVAQQLSDVANSYYLLRYCSPSRVGHEVRLTVTVTDPNNRTGAMDVMFNPGGAGQNCRIEDAPSAPAGSTTPPATPATEPQPAPAPTPPTGG